MHFKGNVSSVSLCLCPFRNPQPKASRSMVWIGSYNLQDASVRYLGIEFFIPHSRYNRWGSGFKSDIALVKLKKKVRFSREVGPVTLPSSTDTFGPSSECLITGWGNIRKGGTFLLGGESHSFRHYKIQVCQKC